MRVSRILVPLVVLLAALFGSATAAVAAPTPSAVPASAPAAPVAAPAVPAAAATPCAPTAKACMSVSKRQAWLTDGAGRVIAGPIAARGGKKGAATPVGTFRVISKDADYWSKAFDAPMPYSVFFKPGYAFHAGSPSVASNGCIHLPRAAAKQFFSTLKVGDTVQIVP